MLKNKRGGGWLGLVLCVMAGVMLLAGGAMAVEPMRSINLGLHATPARGEVTIDGVLAEGEWDHSGQILCTKDARTLLDSESCRVTAMHDAQFLYLAFQFKDATPMANQIDPRTMAGNGWRGDAVQLRCNMDGFITHIDAWYYAPGNLPAMSIGYIDYRRKPSTPHTTDRPTDGLAGGAKLAFTRLEDGSGYVQEMAIPWALITRDGKRPGAGAKLQLGLELLWGDPANSDWPLSRVVDNYATPQTRADFWWTSVDGWGPLVLEERNDLQLPTPAWMAERATEPRGSVAIRFDLPHDAWVTIAIEDAAGNRVRSLVGETLFKAGENTVWWDGLDDRNQPLPAGQYRWVGLHRGELGVKWITSFYQPNTKLPWYNGYTNGAWGPDHGSLHDVATGGGRVYFAGNGVEAGIAVFATDEQGQKIWSRKQAESNHIAYAADDGSGRAVVWTYAGEKIINFIGFAGNGLSKLDAATGAWLELPGEDGKPTLRRPLLEAREQVAGFAADARGIYIAVAGKDQVRRFDPVTLEQTGTIACPKAGALFAPGDGTLLAVTGDAIVRMALETGQMTRLMDGDFAAARRISADAEGNIYVSLGEPRHQVVVLSRQDDGSLKLAREIGRRGGRMTKGLYDPTVGFRNPTGVAVDAQGQLWVVESAEPPLLHPRRTSIWTTDGQWKRDFIGDTFYGGGGIVDPRDPTTAWYYGMRFKLDFERGEHRLVDLDIAMPTNGRQHGVDFRVQEQRNPTEYAFEHDGRTYLVGARGTLLLSRQRPDGRWGVCVLVDPRRNVAWVDRNDDFEVQADEVTRGDRSDDWGGLDYWGCRPSADLVLFFNRGDNHGLRLVPTGMTPGGTPLYDFSRFEPMAGEIGNGMGLIGGAYFSVSRGDRGEYFSEVRLIEASEGAPRRFWYRGDRTGRWTSRLPAPGLVLYPFQVHGAAPAPEQVGGQVLCAVSDFGQRYLFTSDMLLIGQIFRDQRQTYEPWPAEPQRGFEANAMTPGQESFSGFFTRVADGRYLLTTGFTDCRLFEVTGLESLQRMSGSVQVTDGDLVRAEQIRQARLNAAAGGGTVPVVLARAGGEMAMDGDLSDWPAAALGQATIQVDEQRSAQIGVAYDDAHLYVAWDVRDPTPMMPNTASRPELYFKGGDCVDVMFRRAGTEAAVQAGDLRLLITAGEDRSLRTMLYRPISSNRQPFVFDAFEGANRGNAVRMDEVRPAEAVKAGIRRTESGYVVEAAIPWALLGGKPAAGDEGGIDFGVLFGDATNSATSIRAYWSNKATNITADIPSEAKLSPEAWGRWRVGQ